MADGTTQLISLPAPPRPQDEFSREWSNQMNRWLTNLADKLNGVYYLRGSGLYLDPNSFPTSGYGLRAGEVFANDGVLTWVREDDIWAGGFAVSAEVGTVTVSV